MSDWFCKHSLPLSATIRGLENCFMSLRDIVTRFGLQIYCIIFYIKLQVTRARNHLRIQVLVDFVVLYNHHLLYIIYHFSYLALYQFYLYLQYQANFVY